MIRTVVVPCVGWMSGGVCCCLTTVPFLIILSVAGAEGNADIVMKSYAVSKVISFVTGIFPIGLIQYAVMRKYEKENMEIEKREKINNRLGLAVGVLRF